MSRAVQTIERTFHKPTSQEQLQYLAQEYAAIQIQRAWRSRQRAKYLGPEFLWSELSTHAKLKASVYTIFCGLSLNSYSCPQLDRDAAGRGENDPKRRWRRAVFFVNRIEDGNEAMAQYGTQYSEAARKHLETQHWLELIDGLVLLYITSRTSYPIDRCTSYPGSTDMGLTVRFLARYS